MRKEPPYLDSMLWLREQGWSNVKIAEELDTSEASIRRALKKYQREYDYCIDPLQFKNILGEMEKPVQWDLWNGGNIAITADWHIPLVDIDYVNLFLITARKWNCKRLVIAGDFLNGDTYSNYFPKQANAGVKYEVDVAVAVMDKLLDTFDEVLFLKGNHDYRYVRARDYTVSFVEVMQETFQGLGDKLGRVTFSNLDNCIVMDGEQKWYVCHPKTYSSIPGTVARKLTSIHECNVITGHSHHCADLPGINSKYRAVEIGGFMDMAQTEYLQETTTFPHWTKGFGLLTEENGFVLFHGQSVGYHRHRAVDPKAFPVGR